MCSPPRRHGGAPLRRRKAACLARVLQRDKVCGQFTLRAGGAAILAAQKPCQVLTAAGAGAQRCPPETAAAGTDCPSPTTARAAPLLGPACCKGAAPLPETHSGHLSQPAAHRWWNLSVHTVQVCRSLPGAMQGRPRLVISHCSHKWPRGALLVAIFRTRRAALSAVVDLVDLEGSGGPLWTFLWRSTAGWG